MATSVRLNDEFVIDAKISAEASERSVPKQIEYWAKIGRIAIDNPDLTFAFIQETMLAHEEIRAGRIKKYTRRTPRNSDK